LGESLQYTVSISLNIVLFFRVFDVGQSFANCPLPLESCGFWVSPHTILLPRRIIILRDKVRAASVITIMLTVKPDASATASSVFSYCGNPRRALRRGTLWR
jgi:hypothetical protein